MSVRQAQSSSRFWLLLMYVDKVLIGYRGLLSSSLEARSDPPCGSTSAEPLPTDCLAHALGGPQAYIVQGTRKTSETV